MDHIKDILTVLEQRRGNKNKTIIANGKRLAIDSFQMKDIPETTDGTLVGFVDGGNAEVLAGGNFSVQFIRVFGSVYDGLKKLHTFKQEFFVLIQAVIEGNDVCYEVLAFGTDDKFSKVNARDGELIGRKMMLKASQVAGVVRRITELRLAKIIGEKIETGILVLDGDLEAKHKLEEKYLKALSFDNVIMVGLCKTTQLVTDVGESAVAVLAAKKQGKWYFDSHDTVSFVKLHEKSDYVFRMDISDFSKIREVTSALAVHATDPVFLGYPYGLVEADRYARVSNDEKEYLRTLFLSQSGDLARYLHAQDAHSVLDSIG